MIRNILLLALTFLMGCIDPLDFKNKEQQKHLVVEGSFTNEPDLNYVRLTYTQPYDYPYNEYITDAEVFITSSEGEHYQFVNDGENGDYFPERPMQTVGIAGHTYTLNIKVDGKTYRSRSTILRNSIPMDSVHFEVDEQVYSYPGYLERKIRPGYRVLVDYNDPAGEQNFLRWTFASQYELSTRPDLAVPFPKDCCARCFFREKPVRLEAINDRLVNGRKVINQEILFVPFERYLQVMYKLKIYQHSISEEAYQFFRIMGQQKQSTGTVFDPPPAEVEGNMFNVDNQGEQVIGLFDVSSVSVREVTILRGNIDYPVLPYIIPEDCRLLYGGTTEIPEDW